MAKTYPIQQSFSAGEISPKLLTRSDLPGYAQSTLEMTNLIATVQGPAECRSGFRFLGRANEGAEQYCRMAPFSVSYGESYAVIITNRWVYIADRNGLQPANNIVSNSDFNAGGTDWDLVEPGGATITFLPGLCVLQSSGPQPAAIRQVLTVAPGQESADHRIRVNTLPGTDEYRIRIGTAPGDASILEQYTTAEDVQLIFDPGGASTIHIEVWVTEDNSRTVDSVTVQNFVDGPGDYVTFPSPWITAGQVEDIQYEMVPGRNDQGFTEMYLFQRDVPPHVLVYTGGGNWTFDPIDFTSDYPDAGNDEGPWGDDYPGSLAFYKGRLYAGGTRKQPNAIWASEPGDYVVFNLPSDPVVPADAMFLPIDRNGDIQWLRGMKTLFTGMDNSEHIIFSGDGTPPTGQNVDTEEQSSFGSARVQVSTVGEKLAYVSTDRRKVQLTGYQRDNEGWITEDVTYSAEHITEGRIHDLELETAPDQILWATTFSGDLIGMTYDPRRNIIGWHRHTTDGHIVALCVIRTFGVQNLWVAVLRGGIMHFERFSSQKFQMDSFAEATAPLGDTVFPGFDHLAGRTVQVLADGAVHRDVEVAGDGTITIDYEANHIVAGLKFTPRLRTLPVDMLTQDESRTSFMKSWNKIFIRLLDSTRPLINGVRPPVRQEETPMNLREENKTEDVEVSNLGWDLYGSITIEQDLPLPLNISGVFGELDQETID